MMKNSSHTTLTRLLPRSHTLVLLALGSLLAALSLGVLTPTAALAATRTGPAPQYVLCSTTTYAEKRSADGYQSDHFGTYHIQAQLWAKVDARNPGYYCGREYARALLWIPSGGFITKYCVTLDGGTPTSSCVTVTLPGGGPYEIHTSSVALSCGWALATGNNTLDSWTLFAETGTYPC